MTPRSPATPSGTWRFATRLDAAGQPAAVGAAVTRSSIAPSTAKEAACPARTAPRRRLKRCPRLGFTGPQKTLVILAQFANRASVGSTATLQWNHGSSGPPTASAAFYRTASSEPLDLTPAAEDLRHRTTTVSSAGSPCRSTTRTTSTTSTRARGTSPLWPSRPQTPSSTTPPTTPSGNGLIEPEELHITVIAAGYEGSFGGTASCAPNVWGHRWAIGVGAPLVDGKVVGSRGYTQFGESHCRTSRSRPIFPPGNDRDHGARVRPRPRLARPL